MKITVPTKNLYTGERGVEEICWSLATTKERIQWIGRRVGVFVLLIILGYAVLIGVCLL